MKIVIVEDSTIVVQQLERLLARHPRFAIAGTAAGEDEAVELIAAVKPETVLMDLSLAPGSGINVLRRIREAGCLARVMILTNNVAEPLRKACHRLGASHFFDKSEDFEACYRQLQAWLSPWPANERQRLEALHATRLLGAPEIEVFDNLTRLASEVTAMPIAVVSLVDAHRQWLLSHTGTTLHETPRSVAFCAHAILGNDLLEVPDASQDPRFSDNPLVIAEGGLRAYAGMPLVLESGEALGTLAVCGPEPRTLTDSQRRALRTLAGAAVAEIELRRRMLNLERESARLRDAQAHILHLSSRDPLTALPNRATFSDRLNQHVRHAGRSGTKLGVLFLDLDRFKPINDTLGHDVGDDALVTVAERITACLGGADTIARVGGDEFAIVIPGLQDAGEALRAAEQLREALQAPVRALGHTLHLSASVGAAVFPDHGRNGDQLLRHADLAMFHAKEAGGNRTGLYSPALGERAEEMRVLDTELRAALRRDELRLHYQPQIALDDGRLRGVEALLRWEHPHFGILPPNHFIPLAEQRGFVGALTRKVLDLALVQLKAWDLVGLDVPRVSINVSPREICCDFPEKIEAALGRHGVAPNRLEIEITETALVANGVETRQILDRLRAIGIAIAVDDFGVGYSSLSQIHRLPVDCLKIDRSFVDSMETSPAAMAIVRSVIMMADAMGLCTIAEGIERQATMDLLERAGCRSAQGYLIARPLPPAEVTGWLRSRATVARVA